MLDLAVKYEEKLKGLFCEIVFDKKYMFYNAGSYYDGYEADKTTWNKHEFVSLNSSGNIIGYIKYSINRETMGCNGLQIINFTEDISIFGKDVLTCLEELFTKFNFFKLSYCVVVGNPIEKTYDKLTKKYGGRIIGVREKDCKLIDGKYYDIKLYEILNSNYKGLKGDRL